MYVPASFRQTDAAELHALMRAHPLGLLISHGADGLQASPIPFLLYPDEGAHGVLRAHLARANPHWRSLPDAGECLVVFSGIDGYITPNWYPSKAETGKAVPTWNYATVQVRGTVSVVEDPAWLRRQLADLTEQHEGRRLRPWSIDDAPADYLLAQMRAIVGLEIPIAGLEGKWKMSQNKDAADRDGVIEGLRTAGDAHHHAVLADLVERGQGHSR